MFGFVTSVDLPEGDDPLPYGEHGHPWIEFRIGNALLNVFELEGERPGEPRTHVPWVYVDDLEAHYAHAKGTGATIVEELHAYPGSTVYVASDFFWWRELRGAGGPVELEIRGHRRPGRGRAIEDDPALRDRVFEGLRPTAPRWFGILVEIELEPEGTSRPEAGRAARESR